MKIFAVINPNNPHPGNVNIHARVISFTIFQLTADNLLEAPTPIIAVVFVCVVLTGIPVAEESNKHPAAPKSAENP